MVLVVEGMRGELMLLSVDAVLLIGIEALTPLPLQNSIHRSMADAAFIPG